MSMERRGNFVLMSSRLVPSNLRRKGKTQLTKVK